MSRPTSSQGLSALRAAVAPTGAARGAAPAGAVPAPEGDTAVSLGLVQRAQQGDAEAFGELYDLYVDQVYRYIAYRVASAQLAEDSHRAVVQRSPSPGSLATIRPLP